MKLIKLFSILFVFQLLAVNAFAFNWENSAEIETIFADAGVTGTFVVYDVDNNQFIGYNQQRANIQYVPASTYKIPNSIIALSTGVVSGVDEILPYGGGTHDMKAWERDMHLADAIKVSNVPIYQYIARQVGMEKMQTYVEKFQYGNMALGDVVDVFWLKGPLKISAVEQTQFLAKLAQGTLPVDAQSQKLVRDITLLEGGQGWALHGKTGWYARGDDPGLGWWVGWIVKDGHIYAFALNLDGEFSTENLEKRVRIGKTSLCALGLYSCEVQK